MKIKELMSENPIAVGPETPLRDVADHPHRERLLGTARDR